MLIETFGQTKIGDMRFSLFIQQDICGLEIPVQKRVVVSVMHGQGNGFEQFRCASGISAVGILGVGSILWMSIPVRRLSGRP